MSMALWGLLPDSAEGFYQEPLVVAIAFALLVFLVVFSVLTKIHMFRQNRAVAVLASATIALMIIVRFYEQVIGLFVFNGLYFIIAIVIIFFLFAAFFRFFKKRFR